MASGITTYCQGPHIWITRNITKDDFMKICDQMGCHPEAIHEGGFKFINVPGYRSIRIQSTSAQTIEPKYNFPLLWWPYINSDTVAEEWRGNKEILIYAGQHMSTCLKAFDDAYPFTIKELTEFRDIWAEFGILAQSNETKKYTGTWKPKIHG